jgi:signal transduction histidine kinase
MAVLNGAGCIVRASQSFAGWFSGLREGLEGREFGALLGQVNPEWARHFLDWEAGGMEFGELLLVTASAPRARCFRVSVSRLSDTTFVHVAECLPPGDDAESGEWLRETAGEPGREHGLALRLLQTESQLQQLIRRWHGVIFNQRSDMGFNFASPRLAELTGIPLEQWTNEPGLFWKVIHPADVQDLEHQIRRAAAGEPTVSSFRVRNSATGRVTYVFEHREPVRTTSGVLIGYEGVWVDISRQAIAEKRLMGAAWKETLATITMGLAHDFSNILAGIHSLADSIQLQLPPEDPRLQSISLVQRNALAASQLVRRIFQLHEGRIGERGYHDLNELSRDLVELTRRLIPRHIRVEVHYAPQPLPVFADPVEFRQVALNLILNAVDSMPDSGVLRISTVKRDEAVVPGAASFETGSIPRPPCVGLAIEDTGCGIPARHIAKIFDPFFTTKPVNRGSGLGLYNARLFVEKHHGLISVDSVEGTGTTFRVWLPEADFTESDRWIEPESEQRSTLLLLGGPGAGLNSMAALLRRNGYGVAVETQEDSALQLIDSPDYEFGALVVQLGADGSSGERLLQEIRKRRLPFKIVLQVLTGNDDEIPAGLMSEASLVLPRDLPEEELIVQVARLLKGTGRTL